MAKITQALKPTGRSNAYISETQALLNFDESGIESFLSECLGGGTE